MTPPELPPPGLPADPARRRLLALGILATLLAALLFGLVGPLAEALAERAEQEQRQRDLLLRFERVIAQGPALRRELAALDAEIAEPGMLLRAPTASQAAASLQATLRALLEAEGVTPDSAQPLPSAPHGPLTRVAMRIELRTDHETLARVLAAIEAHRPQLLVREALIVAPRDQQGGPPRDGAAGPRLAVRIDVAALAQVTAEAGRG
jgi:Tfp pilus assembly protein PilO